MKHNFLLFTLMILHWNSKASVFVDTYSFRRQRWSTLHWLDCADEDVSLSRLRSARENLKEGIVWGSLHCTRIYCISRGENSNRFYFRFLPLMRQPIVVTPPYNSGFSLFKNVFHIKLSFLHSRTLLAYLKISLV